MAAPGAAAPMLQSDAVGGKEISVHGKLAALSADASVLWCLVLWTVDDGDEDRGQGLWTGFERLLQLANPVVMESAWSDVDAGTWWQHICQTCKIDM